MKACIAIVTIGEACTKQWLDTFAPTVQSYADRHGMDVKHLTTRFGSDEKPPHWEKLLLPSRPELSEYDKIVYLDSDVMCNPNAPDIAATVPDGLVGAVTWKGSYRNDPVYYDWFRASWADNDQKRIRDANLQSFADLAEYGGYPAHEDWLNSGVLVMDKSHADFLASIYRNDPQTETSAYEQQALTYWLTNARKDLLHPIDRRFNTIWYIERQYHYPFIAELHQNSFVVSRCVMATLLRSYFLHFAADGDRWEARNFMLHQGLMKEQVAV